MKIRLFGIAQLLGCFLKAIIITIQKSGSILSENLHAAFGLGCLEWYRFVHI